jgi:hypothetical protein
VNAERIFSKLHGKRDSFEGIRVALTYGFPGLRPEFSVGLLRE